MYNNKNYFRRKSVSDHFSWQYSTSTCLLTTLPCDVYLLTSGFNGVFWLGSTSLHSRLLLTRSKISLKAPATLCVYVEICHAITRLSGNIPKPSISNLRPHNVPKSNNFDLSSNFKAETISERILQAICTPVHSRARIHKSYGITCKNYFECILCRNYYPFLGLYNNDNGRNRNPSLLLVLNVTNFCYCCRC